MSQHKSHQFRPPLYHRNESAGNTAVDAAERNRDAQPTGGDGERRGWDAYRRWIANGTTRVPSERTPLDHSIYSWKGYQNWADRVRQNWKQDEG